jgi:hypothetical protein
VQEQVDPKLAFKLALSPVQAVLKLQTAFRRQQARTTRVRAQEWRVWTSQRAQLRRWGVDAVLHCGLALFALLLLWINFNFVLFFDSRTTRR